MVKMWLGIKAIFKWRQAIKKIHTADANDNEEHSFLSKKEGKDDGYDDDEAHSSP